MNVHIFYVHNDHLGTPVKMTNEIGMVVWQAVYDPFGKATVDEDVDGDGKAVEMNVRFPGQYYDGESGLHYNYFRTYDPALGRYITSDPIGLFGGVNTFGYVFNNPIAYVDFYGLKGSVCIVTCPDIKVPEKLNKKLPNPIKNMIDRINNIKKTTIFPDSKTEFEIVILPKAKDIILKRDTSNVIQFNCNF